MNLTGQLLARLLADERAGAARTAMPLPLPYHRRSLALCLTHTKHAVDLVVECLQSNGCSASTSPRFLQNFLQLVQMLLELHRSLLDHDYALHLKRVSPLQRVEAHRVQLLDTAATMLNLFIRRHR